MSQLLRRAITVTACLGLAGCAEYLARQDSLGKGAGEAVQTNLVTHVIDPWPAHARSTDPTTSGERAARAVERYRTSQTSGNSPGPAATAIVAPAPGATGTPTLSAGSVR